MTVSFESWVRQTLASVLATAFVVGALARPVAAQENYEIQVYASPTVPRGVTIYELHSNFTRLGRTLTSPEGELPTNYAWHETIEITHGFSNWSELGFYWFMAKPDKTGFQWVGTHVRPRFTA